MVSCGDAQWCCDNVVLHRRRQRRNVTIWRGYWKPSSTTRTCWTASSRLTKETATTVTATTRTHSTKMITAMSTTTAMTTKAVSMTMATIAMAAAGDTQCEVALRSSCLLLPSRPAHMRMPPGTPQHIQHHSNPPYSTTTTGSSAAAGVREHKPTHANGVTTCHHGTCLPLSLQI